LRASLARLQYSSEVDIAFTIPHRASPSLRL
jgi:hypothetical protein